MDKDLKNEIKMYEEKYDGKIDEKYDNCVNAIVYNQRLLQGLEVRNDDPVEMQKIKDRIKTLQGELKELKSEKDKKSSKEYIIDTYNYNKNKISLLVEEKSKIANEISSILRNDEKIDFDRLADLKKQLVEKNLEINKFSKEMSDIKTSIDLKNKTTHKEADEQFKGPDTESFGNKMKYLDENLIIMKSETVNYEAILQNENMEKSIRNKIDILSKSEDLQKFAKINQLRDMLTALSSMKYSQEDIDNAKKILDKEDISNPNKEQESESKSSSKPDEKPKEDISNSDKEQESESQPSSKSEEKSNDDPNAPGATVISPKEIQIILEEDNNKNENKAMVKFNKSVLSQFFKWVLNGIRKIPSRISNVFRKEKTDESLRREMDKQIDILAKIADESEKDRRANVEKEDNNPWKVYESELNKTESTTGNDGKTKSTKGDDGMEPGDN